MRNPAVMNPTERLQQIKSQYNKIIHLLNGTQENLTEGLLLWDKLETGIKELDFQLHVYTIRNPRDIKAAAQLSEYNEILVPAISVLLYNIQAIILDHPLTATLDRRWLPSISDMQTEQQIFYQSYCQDIQEQESLSAKAIRYANNIRTPYEGRNLSFASLGNELSSQNRGKRQNAYMHIAQARADYAPIMDDYFNQLIALRIKQANKAGFDSYIPYRYKELRRSYTPELSSRFQESVRIHILPLYEYILVKQLNQSGYTSIRPWDLNLGLYQPSPPAHNTDPGTLLRHCSNILVKLDPEMHECFIHMLRHNFLDIGNNPGKPSGGFTIPSASTGLSFLSMRFSNRFEDLPVFFHEFGHAFHSWQSRNLPFQSWKDYPQEIAELAAVSMELFSMEHWNQVYTDPHKLHQARQQQVANIIGRLIWIAMIERFQHWLYSYPGHSNADRKQAWLQIHEAYTPECVNWNGLNHYREILWQKQNHLYEAPFYSLEYGIAQLGALKLWNQYIENPAIQIQRYKSVLGKGNTLNLEELFGLIDLPLEPKATDMKNLADFLKSYLQ